MNARWEAGMFMSLRFLFSFSAFTCCSWSGRKSEKGEEGMSQWLDYNCSKSLWSSAKCEHVTVHLFAVSSLGLDAWMEFWGFFLSSALPNIPSHWKASMLLNMQAVLNKTSPVASLPPACSSGELWGDGRVVICCLTSNYRQLTQDECSS